MFIRLLKNGMKKSLLAPLFIPLVRNIKKGEQLEVILQDAFSIITELLGCILFVVAIELLIAIW